jgi:hypothetical protein
MIARPLFALACLAVLGGCADRASMETPPVQVATPRGAVTCQLYRHDIVMWDEATKWPDGMQKPQADAVCRDEGRRQKTGA